MWAMVPVMADRPTDEEIDALETEAKDLIKQMDAKRVELSDLRERRRTVLSTMVKAVGMTETAQRLGISRQAVWNVINQK